MNLPQRAPNLPSDEASPSAIAAMISHVNVTNGTLSSWCDSTVFQVEFYFVCLQIGSNFYFLAKYF